MVIDRFENAHLYAGLGGRIAAALALLAREDFRAKAVGKHEVEGASLYYLVQSYTTKPIEQCSWEAHRKYLDVQYVVEGIERFGWAPVSTLKATKPYDPSGDAALFAGDGSHLTAGAGTFLLLWPGDAHMPGVAAGTPSAVLKVVMKVLLAGGA